MDLSRIEQLLREQSGQPPVELWQPPLSGVMDMRIDREGGWYHEGRRIGRQSLVNLFASILRRETDGEYYLVTPVEKWRIHVEDAPLLVVDMEVGGASGTQKIVFILNTGRAIPLDRQHPLTIIQDAQTGEPRPYLELERGLSARLSRAVFYRLVELAEQDGDLLEVESSGIRFTLGSCT